MSLDNKLFDDLTRVAGGAVSILSAVGKQLGEGLKDQMGDKFPSSSFSAFSAANDDVDRLQGVVTKLRMEQEEMKARIASLEAMLGVATKKPAAKKKTAASAKKAVAKKPVKKTAAKSASKKSKPAKKRA
ncbi:MAG TPA: hypothetical protein PKI93_04990 [Alphaproteobacteria bacterium]|nr:hypothetical protein [Alphaproteobacteria bacterium]HNS45022.1 hypothetical protein [Alphaproteobacteria bacterium]